MVEALVIKTEKREESGTRASRNLRERGMIPIVIYGHKQEPVSVAVNLHDIALEIQHHHRLLDVELDGKVEKLLVKDIQYDHLYEKIVHVDLLRVDLDERVEVTVPLELRGTAPGVNDGGVLDQAIAEVQLECVVTNMPERVRAHVNQMGLNDTLLAKDVELPEGATLVTDPETVIATIRVIAEAPEVEEEEGAEPGAAEPEVITRKAEDEEEGSEE